MKNLFKIFGIIALAAIVGFTTFGCKNDPDEVTGSVGKQDTSLNGTWEGDTANGTLKIDGDDWTGTPVASNASSVALAVTTAIAQISLQNLGGGKGSVDISNGKITMEYSYAGYSSGVQVLFTYEIKDGTLTMKDEDGDVAFVGKKK